MFEPIQLGRYQCYERVGTTAYGEVLRARVAGAAVETHFIVRRLAGAVADDGGARRRFVLAATALMPIEDARLVGGGDVVKGRAELAARVKQALEPAPAKPVASEPKLAAAQPAIRIEMPATTGRVVKVPPRPLWLKLAPVVALVGIGVAAWKLLPQ